MSLGYLSCVPGSLMYPYVPGITEGTFGTNSQNKYPAKPPQRQQDGQGVTPSLAHRSSDGEGAAVLQRVCYGAPSIIFTLFLQDLIKQRLRSLNTAF